MGHFRRGYSHGERNSWTYLKETAMRKRYIILVSLVVGGMIGYAAGQPSATDTRIVNAFWDELRAEQEAERAAARATLPPGATINRFFQNLQGDWHSHLGAAAPFSLAAATVHEAKGHEYEAVCVLLPPDPPGRAPRIEPLLDHWESRADYEPKRVVYVGATRARQFLCLSVPRAQKPRIAAILAGNAVPFVERDI